MKMRSDAAGIDECRRCVAGIWPQITSCRVKNAAVSTGVYQGWIVRTCVVPSESAGGSWLWYAELYLSGRSLHCITVSFTGSTMGFWTGPGRSESGFAPVWVFAYLLFCAESSTLQQHRQDSQILFKAVPSCFYFGVNVEKPERSTLLSSGVKQSRARKDFESTLAATTLQPNAK